MKNNTSIVDCKNKTLTLMFQNEIHIVDLREGDLHDNWNSIEDKNGIVWDINFSWEDTKGEKPYLSIYGLQEPNEDGFQSTDWNDQHTLTVKALGNRDIYFREERFKYKFDSSLPLSFEVFDEKDNLILRTKRGNRASDESVYQFLQHNKMCYIVVTDSNGASKKL